MDLDEEAKIGEIYSIILLPDGRISPQGTLTLKNRNSQLYDWIINCTSFLPITVTLSQRLYCIENNITKLPTCVVCNKVVKYQYSTKTYSLTCSSKCSANNPQVKNKRALTNTNKYGGITPANHSAKTKITMQERYGVNKPLQCNEFKMKRKSTLLERYGVDDSNKIPQTIDKKYYTNTLRYGIKHNTQRHIISAVTLLESKEWLYQQHITNNKSCVQIADDLGVGATTVTRAINRYNLLQPTSISSHEYQLRNFLDSIPISYVANDRKIIFPKELDIVIPSHNVAIEMCGHYWHSELQGKSNTYHVNKTLTCLNKNIRLIQIFEGEWITKRPIVEHRLLHILTKPFQIYARECEVKSISNTEAAEFINQYHIQGNVSSTITCGLYYNNMLVGLAGFSPSRFNKKYQYELLRLVFSTRIIGGASKLMQYFIKQYFPTSIVSYSDNRWNTGKVYLQMGFTFSHTTKPNYWYFKNNNSLRLYNRLHFQKHKLKTKLKTYDDCKSEWENMITNGYDRIWDCGNDVFVWKN